MCVCVCVCLACLESCCKWLRVDASQDFCLVAPCEQVGEMVGTRQRAARAAEEQMHSELAQYMVSLTITIV